jgi:hypothetical protein
MPTKVRGRSTVSPWPEVLLPMVAGQKNEPPKGVPCPSRSVEDGTPKAIHSYGRIGAPFGCAMPADSRPFVVARNKRIVPKERSIERLASGYSIREFYNHPQGRYWYVVTAHEVIPTKRDADVNRN